MQAEYLCVLVRIWIGVWVGASLGPPVGCLIDRSRVVLLLCVIYVFLSCVRYAFVRVCLFVPCGRLLGGLASWLSFVVYNCGCVAFPRVSWVRCGT